MYATVTTRESHIEDSGFVVALDTSQGIEWTTDFDAPVTGLAVGSNRVFVRFSGSVAALDRAAGTVDWRLDVDGGPDHGLALAGNRLVYGGDFSIIEVDPENGEKRWIREYDATDFSPVIVGDSVVALGQQRSKREGVLVLLDAAGNRKTGRPSRVVMR